MARCMDPILSNSVGNSVAPCTGGYWEGQCGCCVSGQEMQLRADCPCLSAVTVFSLPVDVKAPCEALPSPSLEPYPQSSIVVTLEDMSLWMKFHQIGTEMIITKSGR